VCSPQWERLESTQCKCSEKNRTLLNNGLLGAHYLFADHSCRSPTIEKLSIFCQPFDSAIVRSSYGSKLSNKVYLALRRDSAGKAFIFSSFSASPEPDPQTPWLFLRGHIPG
jgi:hypothetical protein